jgi:hypothetical protein
MKAKTLRSMLKVFSYGFALTALLTPLASLPLLLETKDAYGLSLSLLWRWPLVCLLISAFFYCLSCIPNKKLNKKFSVKTNALLLGPILFLAALCFLIFGLSYLFLPLTGWPIWALRMTYAVSLIGWCIYKLLERRSIMIKKKYMTKEFTILEDRIVMRMPAKISLDPKIDETKSWRKIYNKALPYILALLPIAYPLQKLLVMSEGGGYQGVLFLLMILGSFIVYYFFASMACGAYLYIYKVWQLERLHGKPVVFDESAYEND